MQREQAAGRKGEGVRGATAPQAAVWWMPRRLVPCKMGPGSLRGAVEAGKSDI